jgi:hypothetical protein
MIPSVLSSLDQQRIEGFLKTTFPFSTPFFHGVMDRFLGEDGDIFKEPYLSIKLPYRTSSRGVPGNETTEAESKRRCSQSSSEGKG